MSCQPCRIDYLMDKTGLLEGCLIRMQNVMTFGAITDQVSEVQKRNVADMREFAAKWKKGRACPHKKDVSNDNKGETKTTGVATAAAEYFTPEISNTADISDLHEDGGNIGISSIPSRAFPDDRTSGEASTRRGGGVAASNRAGAKSSRSGSGGSGRGGRR